jgi:foldase protein PrsA
MRARAGLTIVRALMLAAPAAAAQDDVIFTVTAPSGATYTATEAHLARWIRIADIEDEAVAREQVFELLTTSAWLGAEAAERGIVVTDETVAEEFRAQRRSAFPDRRSFRRFLRQSRQTIADLLFRIRLDLLSSAIRDQVLAGVTVSDEAVEAELAERGNIRVPERRDVRLVLTARRSSAVSAKRELLAGASWRSVARRYSIDDASSRSGGRVPSVTRGTLEPRLARAIFRARKGRVVGPVRTQFGYYVVRVTRVHPGRVLSDARMRTLLRQELLIEAQQKELDRFARAFRATWRSRTVCAPAYAELESCGNR